MERERSIGSEKRQEGGRDDFFACIIWPFFSEVCTVLCAVGRTEQPCPAAMVFFGKSMPRHGSAFILCMLVILTPLRGFLSLLTKTVAHFPGDDREGYEYD